MIMLLIPMMVNSQEITGYRVEGTKTVFLFDEASYNVKDVDKVVVTGTFRNWDQNMNDPEWQLTKIEGTLWRLEVENPDYTLIPPSAEFKFRINDGEWMAPPGNAENAKRGNCTSSATSSGINAFDIDLIEKLYSLTNLPTIDYNLLPFRFNFGL